MHVSKNTSSQHDRLLPCNSLSGYVLLSRHGRCINLLIPHPMETVLRVPGEHSGAAGVMCNFGSGGRVTSGFALCKMHVVCLFSF